MDIPERKQIFGSLCGLVLLMNLGRFVFAPLVDPLKDYFTTTNAGVGIVITLVWIGSASPRIPTGYLLTRFPRRYVVVGAGLVLSIASVFTAFADSILVLGVGCFFMGVSTGVYFISANPLISELYPEKLGSMLGIHGTANQVGAVIAPGFVSLIIYLYSWRGVFLVIGGCALLTTAVLYKTTEGEATKDTKTDKDFLGAALKNWKIIAVGIAIVGLTGFVWNGFFNFYLEYLVDSKSVSRPNANIMLTLVFISGIPAFWYTGKLADRLPNVPLMLAIIGSFIVSMFAATLGSHPVLLFVTAIALGYSIHSLFPVADTFLLSVLPDENRGSAYAVYGGGMMLTQGAGAAVVGYLTDAGLSYDEVFHGFGIGLTIILAGLTALYLSGMIPENRPKEETTVAAD